MKPVQDAQVSYFVHFMRLYPFISCLTVVVVVFPFKYLEGIRSGQVLLHVIILVVERSQEEIYKTSFNTRLSH